MYSIKFKKEQLIISNISRIAISMNDIIYVYMGEANILSLTHEKILMIKH